MEEAHEEEREACYRDHHDSAFAAGFAVLRNDQSAREESQESTSQTEPNAQTEETAQTVSMVQIYVDPSEYDAAVESENDYVSIYQTTSQETVIGKSIEEVGQPSSVKQKRWLKYKQMMG